MHDFLKGKNHFDGLDKKRFGENFHWGVSTSALQTEGAWNLDGKGLSNWDVFSAKGKKNLGGDTPETACDFYHRYPEDLSIARSLNIPNFRFSFSWPRILPLGIGKINQKGIDYYHRLLDACHERHLEPWVTLYHWDLPDELEKKGGWTNREMIHWFEEYVSICVRTFKDKVNHWMILNEPMVFTGAGYFLGIHAPGKRGMKKFLPSIHHAVLCQSIGLKLIRSEQNKSSVGTTFSCSLVTPYSNSVKDHAAAKRVDALLNRVFIEPALGSGYPDEDLPFLKNIGRYMLPGDDQLMKADFDFIGIQNYTREVVAHRFYIPHVKAKLVPADKRKVYHTAMDWEVYPESVYEMIKKFSGYAGVKEIIITENGAAFHDKIENGKIYDEERIHYLANYLAQVLRAKEEGYKVNGYFIWSLTDNFEWAEGYRPRFGLVHVDFKTQQRTVKESGYWYKKFLSEQGK